MATQPNLPIKETTVMNNQKPWLSKRMYMYLFMIVGGILSHWFPQVKSWVTEPSVMSILGTLGAFLTVVTKDKIKLW